MCEGSNLYHDIIDNSRLSSEPFTYLDWLGRHQRFARNGLVFYLTRAGAFDATAESFFDIADRQHHRLQLIRLQAGFLVGTRKVSIQGEVLFDQHCPQGHSGDCHFNARRMIGIACGYAKGMANRLHGSHG